MRLRVAIGITWGVAIGLVILNLYEIQRTCQSDQGSSDPYPMPVEHMVRNIQCPPCALNSTPEDSPLQQQMQAPLIETTTDKAEEEEVRVEVKEEVIVEEKEEYKVPNIVHYVWYATTSKQFEFHQMLSMFSAFKMLQPESIYFHTNMQPYGSYWERVLKLPTLTIVHRNPPHELYGEKIKDPVFYTSHSNVDRLKILSEYGGIYLDLDVLVTKSFDDLRKYECVVGLELPDRMCNSVIVCNKDSPYLMMWLNSFLDDYQVEEWSYNSGKVPYRLARRYPSLVHVEADTINRPNFKELYKIWGSVIYDWQNNYAIHLWFRVWKTMSPFYKGEDPDDNNIMVTENTFSRIARFILHSDAGIFGDQISESVSDQPTDPLVDSIAKDLVNDIQEDDDVETVIQPRHGPTQVLPDDEQVETIEDDDLHRQPQVVVQYDADDEVGEEDEEQEERKVTLKDDALDREAYLKKIQLENQQRIKLQEEVMETMKPVTEQQLLEHSEQLQEQQQSLQLPEQRLPQAQLAVQQSIEQREHQLQLPQQQQRILLLPDQGLPQPQLPVQQSTEQQEHQLQVPEQQLQQQESIRAIQDTMKQPQSIQQPVEQEQVAEEQQPQAAENVQPQLQQQLQQQQPQNFLPQQQQIQVQQPQHVQQFQQEQQNQRIIDNNSLLKGRLDNIKHTTISHKHPYGSDFKLWPNRIPALDAPGVLNQQPIQPQLVNLDLQNIKVTTLKAVTDLETSKAEEYTPLKPNNNPFHDAFLPRKVYVQPEGQNTDIQNVDAIPDKAWLLDDGPKFQGVVNHIQSEKSRQEHLLNQLYEKSRGFRAPGGFQPLGHDVAPPVVVAEDSNDLDLNPALDLNSQWVNDNLVALAQDEFPDDEQVEGEKEMGVDAIEEQMKKEAIGGMDTAEGES